ncbi:uncharacterized protein [Gorilla gorilla gorilla]|uniref:uncharacterized protein isoform X2 n=1 Tax=Gorilla gorilla gorilla TaxID=9595 RepID=UPI0030098E07
MVLRGVRLMKWRDEKTFGTDCVEAVILLVTLLWEKKEAFHVGFSEELQKAKDSSKSNCVRNWWVLGLTDFKNEAADPRGR